MIVVKLFAVMAFWAHAYYHDKSSGYAGFLSLLALIVFFMFERHNPKKKKAPNILIKALNVIVLISFFAFIVTLHFNG